MNPDPRTVVSTLLLSEGRTFGHLVAAARLRSHVGRVTHDQEPEIASGMFLLPTGENADPSQTCLLCLQRVVIRCHVVRVLQNGTEEKRSQG